MLKIEQFVGTRAGRCNRFRSGLIELRADLIFTVTSGPRREMQIETLDSYRALSVDSSGLRSAYGFCVKSIRYLGLLAERKWLSDGAGGRAAATINSPHTQLNKA